MTTLTEKETIQVLIIEDESQIRSLLRMTLEDAGYHVSEAETGKRGLLEASTVVPDVIILDLGLPDMTGDEVLRQLRAWTQTPVLILSVFGQEGSKISGLDAGADDYLTKPYGDGELLARLRALLRRVKGPEASQGLRFGSVEVDLVRRRVLKNGVNVKLTAREYEFLRLLVTHRDTILTHKQILTDIWGPEGEGQTHYLRIFMMRLRRKLEDNPDEPRFLQTESGVGYRLVVDGN